MNNFQYALVPRRLPLFSFDVVAFNSYEFPMLQIEGAGAEYNFLH